MRTDHLPLLLAIGLSVGFHVCVALLVRADGVPALGAQDVTHSQRLDARLSSSPIPATTPSIEETPTLPASIKPAVDLAAPSESKTQRSDDLSADSLSTPEAFGLMPYLPATLLDVRPSVIVDIPENPEDLQQFYNGGTMTISLWINRLGGVDAVYLEKSNLPKEFEEAVMKYFYGMLFQPGMKDGVAVPSQFKMEVRFLPRIRTSSKSPEELRKSFSQ